MQFETGFASQQSITTEGAPVGLAASALSSSASSSSSLSSASMGNKWYYLLYPLANINALWETDVDFLKAQWTLTHGSRAASEALWRQVYSYLLKEQKSVYQVLPALTVINGQVGLPPRGQGQYHYDNYLRIVEIRVHKDRILDFEKFVKTNVVTAVANFLPRTPTAAPDKLPRYMRTVKIAARIGAEPELIDLLTNYVVPAAQSTGTDVFVYRGVYSSGANYFLLFPFDNQSSVANTQNRVISTLLQRAYPAAQAQQLDAQFGNVISSVQELVSAIRPDMSSNLENKFNRWW